MKEKENLESQLKTLQQRLQVSENKFSRELNNLHRQLEVERISQMSKAQNDIVSVDAENPNKVTSESATQKSSKVLVK